MKHTHAIALMGTALLLVGCGSRGGRYQPTVVKKVEPAKVAAGEEASLFPLKVGNSWTYRLEGVYQTTQGTRSGTVEVTFQVTAVQPTSGGERATLSVTQDGKVQDKQVWDVTGNGIYQLSAGKTQSNGTVALSFNPPQPQIMFPLKEGSTFKWKGSGPMPIGDLGTGTTTNRYLGSQVVDTDLQADGGRVAALCVDTQGTFKAAKGDGVVSFANWWAPGVGLVRVKYEAATKAIRTAYVMRLKSFTLK